MLKKNTAFSSFYLRNTLRERRTKGVHLTKKPIQHLQHLPRPRGARPLLNFGNEQWNW